MSIWVDADACPKAVREILFRAAKRAECPTILVANQALAVPKSPWISMRQVAQGFDVADDHIAQHCQAGDLVITSDIPLAAEAVAKGAQVISSRGDAMTAENVRQRLNMRDFMETMRSTGEVHGGPSAYGQREKQAFANALDRYLARSASSRKAPPK